MEYSLMEHLWDIGSDCSTMPQNPLVAQCENIGHPVRGIVVPNLHQYHHLGDALTETDNLPYNPDLKPFEIDGKSSGTLDDRWAFTNRSSFLDYQTAAALAAASRALRGYNNDLADRSLACAKRLLEEANEAGKNTGNNSAKSPSFFDKCYIPGIHYICENMNYD